MLLNVIPVNLEHFLALQKLCSVLHARQGNINLQQKHHLVLHVRLGSFSQILDNQVVIAALLDNSQMKQNPHHVIIARKVNIKMELHLLHVKYVQ